MKQTAWKTDEDPVCAVRIIIPQFVCGCRYCNDRDLLNRFVVEIVIVLLGTNDTLVPQMFQIKTILMKDQSRTVPIARKIVGIKVYPSYAIIFEIGLMKDDEVIINIGNWSCGWSWRYLGVWYGGSSHHDFDDLLNLNLYLSDDLNFPDDFDNDCSFDYLWFCRYAGTHSEDDEQQGNSEYR